MTTPVIQTGLVRSPRTDGDSSPILVVHSYGAAATVPYESPTCADEIMKSTPGGLPLRHAFDCITSPESVSTCLAALGRAGGRYACLEGCKTEWADSARSSRQGGDGIRGVGTAGDFGWQ
ncbi:hypothetical protein B0H66DRAFT_99044 [Apodospora peruviana]|uniref:Uncharacterized protein n=1 Tax=Apodospora peruviana TaxID=516989 RepID=A0AAE0IUK3_9PEZI|nr:hypothetical protein B0H66DRAFT_99044 [Apodospora peruviana]